MIVVLCAAAVIAAPASGAGRIHTKDVATAIAAERAAAKRREGRAEDRRQREAEEYEKQLSIARDILRPKRESATPEERRIQSLKRRKDRLRESAVVEGSTLSEEQELQELTARIRYLERQARE